MKKKNVEPICKNCEYFYDRGDGDATAFAPYHKYYGKCSCPKFRYRGFLDENEENGEKDGLVYNDHEGYDADFDVGIEFGCKHFKPKKGE